MHLTSNKANKVILLTALLALLLVLCLPLLKAVEYLRRQIIIGEFTKIYATSGIYPKTYWLGIPSHQYVTDNWVMQEMIYYVVR